MAVPANGIYRLAPYKNINQVIDIQGRSTSDYASAIIHSQNGGDPCGNHQKAFFYPTTADPSKYTFMFLHSGKRLDKEGASLASKSNAIQYHAVDYLAQWWTPIEDTTNTGVINGETLNSFEIALSNSLGTAQVYCLDYANGQTTNSTNVQVYYHNDTVAQRWFFVKDSLYSQTLPVPASICAAAQNGEKSKSISVGNSNTISLYWECSEAKYQMRYRMRARAKTAGASTFGDWGLWTSPSGTTTDDGWGNVWAHNITALTKQITPSFNWTTNDKYEIQLQVRSWSDAITFNPYEGVTVTGAYGSSAVDTITVTKTPTVSVTSTELTFDGLKIDFTTDYTRQGRIIRLCNLIGENGLICVDRDIEPNEEIPYESLRYIPQEDEDVEFEIMVQTPDGTNKYYFSDEITLEDENDPLTLTVTNSGYSSTVSISEEVNYAKYFITYEHEGRKVTEQVDETFFPPFASYKLSVVADTDDGTCWGTNGTLTLQSYEVVWDWDGYRLTTKMFEDVNAVSDVNTRVSNSYKFQGDFYYSYFFDDGCEADKSCTAVFKSSDMNLVNKLRNASYALFRTPDGGRFHIAILESSVTRLGNGYYSVSLKQMEQS